MSMLSIALRYGAFAIFATALNLLSQALILHFIENRIPFALFIAMGFGTGVALVTKYILDKYWIFMDYENKAREHARKFALYSATGIITTALFWGMEYGFNALTPDGRYRYVGAVLGLAIGYASKFWLDCRFVFSSTKRSDPNT